MDENYLDSLLNELALDNEIDESVERQLDEGIRGRKVELKEDTFDDLVNRDSKTRLSGDDDLLDSGDFDDLDELDKLADFDMDGLDFDDMDFDDVDILDTKGKKSAVKESHAPEEVEEKKKPLTADSDISDLSISENFYEDENANYGEALGGSSPLKKEDDTVSLASQPTDDDFVNTFDEASEKSEEKAEPEPEKVSEPEEIKFAESEDEPKPEPESETDDKSEDKGESDGNEEESDGGEKESSEIDDLLDMLGLEEENDGTVRTAADKEEEEGTEGDIGADPDTLGFGDDGETKDLEGIITETVNEVEAEEPPKKKKKSLKEIIFGEDDEEDEEDVGPSPEEIAAKKAAKAAKKAEKEAAKKAKAEEAKAAKAAKKAADAADKAAKKAVKEAQRKKEEAEAEPEKKLNPKLVALIIFFFAAIGVFVVVGTKSFSYSLVIQKATDYFNRQKYRLAYNEILGVEVKEKDKDLESRIYTVMYVERLYESYETNISLKRYDKALDSLLRGLKKYDERLQEAIDLGIEADINDAKTHILTGLMSTYGLTEEGAREILELSNYDYKQKIDSFAVDLDDEKISLKSSEESTDEETEPTTEAIPSTEASTEASEETSSAEEIPQENGA